MPADEPTTETSQPEPGRLWPRQLRVGLAMACLTLCFAAAAFWGQSYRYVGSTAKVFFDTWLGRAVSWQGRIAIVVYSRESTAMRAPHISSLRFKLTPSERDKERDALRPRFLGFSYLNNPGSLLEICMPHWSLVLLFGSLAVLFRTPPRMRFGLRELLVVVTLAAVVLGAVEALMRAANELTPHGFI